MGEEKEYIDCSNLIYSNVEGLEENEEIKVENFLYEKHMCSREIGNEKLDAGVNPEKRITIEECEKKGYLTKKLDLNHIIIIMDSLLLQQIKLLKGSHPFLSVLNCYYLHNSNVIPCNNDSYFFEKIFWEWINKFCADKIYIDIFKTSNNDFIMFMENEKKSPTLPKDGEGNIDEIDNKNKIGNNRNDNENWGDEKYKSMCKENYIKDNIFIFFQLFLICYCSSTEIIDKILADNELIHRDDYKSGMFKTSETLIYICRKKRSYILKNIVLIKRCFNKFLIKFEEIKNAKLSKKGKNSKKRNTSIDENEKLIYMILKRVKFIVYFVSILSKIAFETSDTNFETVKDDCTQILKCIHDINKDANFLNNIFDDNKNIIPKYFNNFFLMNKLNNISKNDTNICVKGVYDFYEHLNTDIEYIVKNFEYINSKSIFLDIVNIIHYIKYYSNSNNILTKSIARIVLYQIMNMSKTRFDGVEYNLLMHQINKGGTSQEMNKSIGNMNKDGNLNKCKNDDIFEKREVNDEMELTEGCGSYGECSKVMKDEERKNEGDIKNDVVNLSKVSSGNYTEPCREKEQEEKMKNEEEEEEEEEENGEMFDIHDPGVIENYYTMLLNKYIKEESKYPYYKNMNKELENNIKDNIFVNFFLNLYFSDTYAILETIEETSHPKKITNANFYVKNIIFNDLQFFGFSPSLIILFINFVNIHEVFFMKIEEMLKIDKVLNYKGCDKYKKYLKEVFNAKWLKIFELKLRYYFPYLINYMEKDISSIELLILLDEFIDNLEMGPSENPYEINENKDNIKVDNLNKDNTIPINDNIYDKGVDMNSVTKNRLKFLIMCKIFNLFFDYAQIIVSKILNYSFLLGSREHTKLINFHKDIHILYALMRITICYFTLYNMKKEVNSIENYFNSLVNNILIDYNCLSIYINLHSDQEYAFTYYALSMCYKELLNTLQKHNVSKNNSEQISKISAYSLYYYILYLYSDFLMIYFIYISYTNKNVEQIERNSYDMKYKDWNFCCPDVCKIDFNNFQKNKYLLINSLLKKELNIEYTDKNEIIIGDKKGMKNIEQVKKNYSLSEELVQKYTELVDINNRFIDFKFNIFNTKCKDIDIASYFKQFIHNINKCIKESLYNNNSKYNYINMYLNAYSSNMKKSYKNIPPFCIENISSFLNPQYEVVSNHPYFLSVRQKIKK
ncbi:conserved Plasmodium protein, unknown function [Plasmodium vinckei brucechwatti]|uniref:NAA35-like N-terminal domain-containing protein n=1 Tax=Plasmodium vinckei brucechwatti TaxID=119398 RepID=A0A6V7S7K1_PLAVN|nr:conserved Plasmodium protein, unknown function [Plasmodium vinckei brucechwatti]